VERKDNFYEAEVTDYESAKRSNTKEFNQSISAFYLTINSFLDKLPGLILF